MSRIGIRSCSLGGVLDSDAMRRVRELGLDALELSFNRDPGLDPHDRARAARIRAEAERLDVRVSAHAPEEAWLSDPDHGAAVAAAERLSRDLGGIRDYGARLLVLHACPYRPAVPGRSAAQLDGLCAALNLLAAQAEQHDIPIAVETLTRQSDGFTSRLGNILAALALVDSPWVGVCVDTNHLNTTEPLLAGVNRVGERLLECHCNDNHGVREEHLLPFDGAIDWPGFARVLAGIGFDGPLILEPSHYDEVRFDGLPSAVAAAALRLRACVEAASAVEPASAESSGPAQAQ